MDKVCTMKIMVKMIGLRLLVIPIKVQAIINPTSNTLTLNLDPFPPTLSNGFKFLVVKIRSLCIMILRSLVFVKVQISSLMLVS